MINNLNILLPEIFLSLSIFTVLILGVFIKKSYNLITKLSLLILIICIFIIFNNDHESVKVFSGSFVSNTFTNFFKILILISSIFVLNFSQIYIKEKNIAKFEYPIIILLSILGMFFMISSNDFLSWS
jgi:NADH-quinone oxidoreductase subunit N